MRTVVIPFAVVLGALSVAAVLVACGPSLPPYMPTAEELVAPAEGGQAQAGLDVAALKHGRNILENRCGQCHKHPWPNKHTAEAWPRTIARMSIKARLYPEETRDLQLYLQTAANAYKPPEG